MQLTIYDVFRLIVNVLQTYIVALYFKAFFNMKLTNKVIGFISFFAYYLIISITYLFINIPIINLIINIVAFFIITLNYKVRMTKRIIVIVSMYSIFFMVEVLVFVLFKHLRLPTYKVSPKDGVMLEMVAIQILAYTGAIIIDKHKRNRKDYPIPAFYWLILFLIPIGIMYVSNVLYQAKGVSQVQLLMSGLILLLINVLVFYLYDELGVAYARKQEQVLLKHQNYYYNQQFDLIQESTKKVRILKHDLTNHMFVIQAYIKMNQDDKAINYISKIIDDAAQYHEYVESGNIVIDSILNFKLAQAEEKDIQVLPKVLIPKDLGITPYSMTVILGNLLDNAMNATLKLNDKRRINIDIKYNDKRLMIKVENTFNGKVVYENGQIVTMQKDKGNHGIGLQSVKRIVDQYQGELIINHTQNTFAVRILLSV